jgi:hypothetical protein
LRKINKLIKEYEGWFYGAGYYACP